uniref:Small ribosomal subunit protein uS15 N-terminal domain-containing protein n=2 Tax=Bos TaxID=9903 RepID=A0A4W2EZL4_BOBOX
MGCMHAPRKGLSQLVLSPRHRVPTWLKLTPEVMKEQTYKLVKKSLTPSRIGVVLRDSHAVTQYIL